MGVFQHFPRASGTQLPSVNIVCRPCKERVRDCPTCRQPMPANMTNSLAAALIEKVQHRCKFSDQGCEVKMILKDLVTHEKQCLERPIYRPSLSASRHSSDYDRPPVITPSRTPSAYDRPCPSRMSSVSPRPLVITYTFMTFGRICRIYK